MGNHTYNVYIYDKVNFDLHFHKNYEIVYVISGQAVYSVNGKTKTLEQGDFAFCLSNEIHSVNSIGESKIWIGVFSEDFVHEFKNRIEGKTGTDFKFRCREATSDFLLKNLIHKTNHDILMIKACLYALTSEYLEQIPLTERNDRRGTLMSDIVEYISENYRKPFSLKTLSSQLGYDYCYLSRAFNDMFSMSFTDYINTFRIDHALSLLTSTELSITDIAYESGFQSIRSFNNVFKNRMGISPVDYRKKR
jgi:AraC-like DNA-binding protein